MSTKGTALNIVKAAEEHNGVEAWLRLLRRYDVEVGQRARGLLQKIINPGTFPEDLAGFEGALLTWEGYITKYESISDDVIQDSLKINV